METARFFYSGFEARGTPSTRVRTIILLTGSHGVLTGSPAQNDRLCMCTVSGRARLRIDVFRAMCKKGEKGGRRPGHCREYLLIEVHWVEGWSVPCLKLHGCGGRILSDLPV